MERSDFLNSAVGIGVAIPAYRAEASIAAVVTRVRALGYPVLVVDDGSPDETSRRASQAGASVVRLPTNQGKGTALWTALVHARAASWTWMVAMDADGQHDPSCLAAFQEATSTNVGVVVGARRLHPDVMPLPRVCSNRLTTALLSLQAGCPLFDSQCGYRMYRVEAAMGSRLPEHGRFEWESEALVRIARKGWKVGRVEVPTLYGEEISNIRPWRDTSRFVGLWFRLWREILGRRI